MTPGKIDNDNNGWSDGMSDEANEELPFFEDETSPEENALHIIDPMDDNPDSESQHVEPSDAVPYDLEQEADLTVETAACAHPSCRCQVTDQDFCSDDCENPEKMESESCQCNHNGCEHQIELMGLSEI